MTTTARRTAAALAVGGVIAAAGFAAHPGAPPPPAECHRYVLPGEWRCTYPTPGRSAVVIVHAFEDGSAHATPVDPDHQEATR